MNAYAEAQAMLMLYQMKMADLDHKFWLGSIHNIDLNFQIHSQSRRHERSSNYMFNLSMQIYITRNRFEHKKPTNLIAHALHANDKSP